LHRVVAGLRPFIWATAVPVGEGGISFAKWAIDELGWASSVANVRLRALGAVRDECASGRNGEENKARYDPDAIAHGGIPSNLLKVSFA
jgi:hypothetical protein